MLKMNKLNVFKNEINNFFSMSIPRFMLIAASMYVTFTIAIY